MFILTSDFQFLMEFFVRGIKIKIFVWPSGVTEVSKVTKGSFHVVNLAHTQFVNLGYIHKYTVFHYIMA